MADKDNKPAEDSAADAQAIRDAHFAENGVDESNNTPKGVTFDEDGTERKED